MRLKIKAKKEILTPLGFVDILIDNHIIIEVNGSFHY